MFEIRVLAPLLLAVAIPYAALTFLGPRSGAGRAIASLACVAFGARYLWWRWTMSMPEGQAPWQQAWAWSFLGIETAAILSSLIVYLFMSRVSDRSAEVDRRAASPLQSAAVDIFIVTYNEDRDILERTIVGALSIDHPDLRVWVLDDGARDWVRDLAAELGANYTFRVKGKYAKAGNVNHGLEVALSVGRRPEFVLLLDADFVPAKTILRRTLPLFEEADVGIVQTPQHFFNPDPIQSNLLCSRTWPDEQRFFFNYLLSSKDAWGCAFCCGTSAVFRVTALEACGGMATETVTEDMLTTFKMLEHGYRTVFLNERLSLGLAPEGLKEYVSQRSRWCLGCIQQLYTRWSFIGRARLNLVNRLSCFDGVLYWTASFAFRILMMSAPMVYWWTGTAVINSTAEDIVLWLGPYLLCGMVFIGCLASNTVFPVMTDVTQLLSSFSIVRTVATALVKPWGHPFKVTAKGVQTAGVTVQWRLLLPYAFMAVAAALGMIVNMSPYSPLNGTPGFSVNVYWTVLNVTVLSIACAVCVELPKRRRDERFASGERAAVEFAGSASECTVLDISLCGARLRVTDPGCEPRSAGTLSLDDDSLRLPFDIVRITGDGSLAVEFRLTDRLRRALIRKLFTGGYANEVERISIGRTLVGAISKVFS